MFVRTKKEAGRLLEASRGFFQYGELKAWSCCRGRAVAGTAGRKEWIAVWGQTIDTLVSTQRDFHSHPTASHYACIYITTLIHSPFFFSDSPALIPCDGMSLSRCQWRDDPTILLPPFLYFSILLLSYIKLSFLPISLPSSLLPPSVLSVGRYLQGRHLLTSCSTVTEPHTYTHTWCKIKHNYGSESVYTTNNDELMRSILWCR